MIAVGRWVFVALTTVCALVFGLVGPAYAEDAGGEATPAAALPSSGKTLDELAEDLTAAQIEQIGVPDEPAPPPAPERPAGDYSVLAAESSQPDEVTAPAAVRLPLQPVPAADMEKLAREAASLPVAQRDEFSVTYRRADGSVIRRSSVEPLSVERPDGTWVDISTRLERSGGDLVVADHPLELRIDRGGADAGALTATRDGASVTIAPIGAAQVSAQVKGAARATADFPNVFRDTDLTYDVERTGVKETLVLDTRPVGRWSWSWSVDAGELTPSLDDEGAVSFANGEGDVVMQIPTPVMWDSSGVEGERDPAMVNPEVTFEKVTEGWRYTLRVDPRWLSAKERVYPVYIDPSLYTGPSGLQSYKSDGTIFQNQMHTGNTRQNNKNVFWRAVSTFPYGGVPGNFIAGAQLNYIYAGTGTTSGQDQWVNWAGCWGYNCVADDIAYFNISNGNTWTGGYGGTTLAQHLVNRFAVGDTGVSFITRGSEGGYYTHKRMHTELYIEYWGFPSVSQVSPADGATGLSLTPQLSMAVTDYSPHNPGIAYQLTLADNPGMANPLWTSGWIGQAQASVPAGLLLPNRTYYWQARAYDAHSGWLGQSTERATGVRSFRTQQVPPTPPVESATPGTAQGQPETITTLTPTLTVGAVADPDNVPANGTVTYEFKIATGADGKSGAVYTSGMLSASPDGKVRWQVPEGVLQDGGIYSWIVQPYDGIGKNTWPTWVKKIKVDRRLGSSGPSPFDSAGPATVNLANGNLNVSFSSPTVSTLGGPMGMVFSYNSQAVKSTTYGLTGSYYDGKDLNGNAPGMGAFSFAGKTPIMVRTDAAPNFDWGGGSPGPALNSDYFMVRWNGYITLPNASSRWRIGMRSDDGYRVSVNNALVLDSWNTGTALTWSGDKNYGTAAMPIQIDYYEATGAASIELWADDLDDGLAPFLVPGRWLSRTPTVLPEGWSSSTPLSGGSTEWSKAAITDSAVVLTDLSGMTHTYTKTDGSGVSFAPPVGEYGVVSINGAGRVVYTDEAGTVHQFGADGKVESITPVADSMKPATPVLIRDASGRVSAVADPVSWDGSAYQRKVTFVYQNAATAPVNSNCATLPPNYVMPSEGMLCKIEYPDGSATDLYYGPGNTLWMIQDPGGERTWFEYQDRLLTSIQDTVSSDWLLSQPEGGTSPGLTEFTYTNGKVASVTLPPADGDWASPRTKKTYSYGQGTTSTSLVGVSGATSTVTFDAGWRELTRTSPLGVSVSQAWKPNKDLVVSTTASTGEKSTTVYDPVTDRPLASYGPAPAACYDAEGVPVSTCPIVPAKSATAYDQGLQGLHVAYYTNTKQLVGQPKAFSLGLAGSSGGVVDSNWGAGAPLSGLSSDNFSLRMTGLITFPQTGNYVLRTTSDDGVRVWLDDTLVINRWSDSSNADTDSQLFTATAGQVRRIRVEYYENQYGAALALKWATPTSNSAFSIVPGSALRPDYGLVTRTTADDSTSVSGAVAPSVSASYTYQHPWLGAATASTVDPGGLGLTTGVSYEQPGASGWLRRLTRTLPAGMVAGAPASAKTTSAYYGDLEVAPNVCGVSGVKQFGMLKSKTGPAPASGSAITTEYVYDVMGRVVGSRSTGDTGWSCTSFDARGRVVSQTIKGPDAGTRTVTTSYEVVPSEAGVTVRVTDDAAPGVPTVTKTDLLGRVTRSSDVWGTVTTTVYEALTGRVASSSTTPPGGSTVVTGYTYDLDGKVLTVTVDGVTEATVTYDTYEQFASVTYGDGSSLVGVGRDVAGRVVSNTWSVGGQTVADQVVRSQSGRIVQHTSSAGSTSYTSTYAYDGAGRLVGAKIPGHELTYQFASSGGCGVNTAAGLSGNRTGFTDAYTAPGTSTAVVSSTAYCYDWADRLTSTTVTGPVPGATGVNDGLGVGEVVYDVRGNVTTLSDMQFTYDSANRHSGTTYADGTTTTVVRDASGAVVSRTIDPAGVDPAVQTRFLFAGGVLFGQVTGSALTRFVSLPGGVNVTVTTDAVLWGFPNLQGHQLITREVTGAGSSVSGLGVFDPFGQPLDPVTLAYNTPAATETGEQTDGVTGWHQGARKLTETAGSVTVIEMGARLYVPALGRFLQVDPIEGGVDNDYVWPTDPIGSSDITGTRSRLVPGVSVRKMASRSNVKSIFRHTSDEGAWTDNAGRIGKKWGMPVREVKRAIEKLKGAPGQIVRGGGGPRRNPDIEVNVDNGDVRIKGGNGDVVDNLRDYVDEYRLPVASPPQVDWGPIAVSVGMVLVFAGAVLSSPLQLATG